VGIEDLVKQFGGGKGGGMLPAAMGLIDKAGGLNGLLGKLQQSGLGEKAQSWVGTGQNQPVSSQEVRQALGDDQIRDVAQQAGVSEEEACQGLADGLPQVVDHLTPDGQVDEGRAQELVQQARGGS